MTEEEKKAIERMTEVRDKKLHTFIDELTIVLNLIQKQNNRLAELEKENKRQSIAIIGYQEELEPIHELNIPVETLVAEFKRLENIEDGREQLKQINEGLKAMLKNKIRYTQELEQDLFENCSNYVVPKSVIREKIDKLEREFHFFAGREHAEWQDGEFDGDVCDDLALQIGTLKGLLGEEI